MAERDDLTPPLKEQPIDQTELVEAYAARMIGLINSRMPGALRSRMDSEDVVQSAWKSFFHYQTSRSTPVDPSHDLWPLLATFVSRKLNQKLDLHYAQKRDRQRESSDLLDSVSSQATQANSEEELADEFEAFLNTLSEMDRLLIRCYLAGMKQEDIANTLNCSDRTIRRALTRLSQSFHSSTHDPIPVQHFGKTFQWNHTIAANAITLKSYAGAGRFAKIYRSNWTGSTKPVAVKFLKKQFWSDPHARLAIIREFDHVSQIKHPHITQSHGWGTTETGAIFLVREWIDGKDLTHWGQKKHSLPKILNIALSVTQAVQFIHSKQLLHGDLSPANVLISNEGHVQLTDFGFSQNASYAMQHSGGTPGFMAPELVTKPTASVTYQSDMYSLGSLLVFLFTGHHVNKHQQEANLVSLDSIVTSIPKDLNREPFDLTQLNNQLKHCLQATPEDRPNNADALLEALSRLSHSVDELNALSS